jgi:hypothetical protein
MKRLIKVEDIGCGDYTTRPKHYCYINIPEEYIIKQYSPYPNIIDLTEEGESYVENNAPCIPHGYLSYKSVTDEHRESIIKVYEEQISRLQFELNELKMN